APSRGQPDAPVTIVMFEDYLCPFCKDVQAQFAEIQSRYAGRVRFVHRDFPIEELHPGARRAHEAARCASAQDKFWPYHDLLYANAPKLSPDDLTRYAGQAGLDVAAFETCLGARTYQTAIQQDIEEGQRLGVTATPTFFINGRTILGSLPLARFVEVI